MLIAGTAVAQQQRIYLANDDHTDYFWVGTDADYRRVLPQMLDFYMDQAERTADRPANERGRFNCDGSFWLYEFERNRPPEAFERLIGHVRAGNISVPFQSLVLLPGAMPTEAVLRDMYYAGRLERRFGLDLELAVMMENATLPGGIASLWAGSGARYSWKGVCGCVSQVGLERLQDRPREIYHFEGPDGQSVLMKWNSLDFWASLGGYAEARDPAAAVAYMTGGDAAYAAAWPWPVKAAFGYGFDDLFSMTDALVDAARELTNAERRVIVSNEVDFFEDFEANHGHEIPTFGKSLGNEWDLHPASLGEVTASMRRAMERLRAAEAMAAVALVTDPDALEDRAEARDEAFVRIGLYYEHNWIANGPVPANLRLQFQRDTAAIVRDYVETLHSDAREALGALVVGGPGRQVVFNPLSWVRTDVVDLGPVEAAAHAVDVASGAALPSQVTDGRLEALVADVPSVGFRVVEVRPGAGPPFPDAATVEGASMESERYRVTLGRDGAITEWVDLASGRDLVRPGGGLSRKGPGGDRRVSVAAAGPVRTTLRIEVPGAPRHVAEVSLLAGVDRVEVVNRITENFGAVTGYDFEFALGNDFVARHEEVGMIARAARAADGGDYADTGTRTDYLTLNHFVDLSEPERGVTLSSWDSQFFRLGESQIGVLDTAVPSVFAVVGMQSDGDGVAFPNQGGDSAFLNRYALRAHGGYDGPQAMRFALAHQNPLVAMRATGGADAPLGARPFALLETGADDVLAWAVKPAEEGIEAGVVVRLWNLAERPRMGRLHFPGSVAQAVVEATHVETDIAPGELVCGQLQYRLERQQLATWRAHISPRDRVPPPPPDAGMPPPDGAVAEPDAAVDLDAAVEPPDAAVEPPDAAVLDEDGALLGEDGALLGEDGALLGEDGAVLGEDGAVLGEDGAAADEDGAAPDEDGAAPDEDGAVPDEDGALCAMDGGLSELDDAEPAGDSGGPAVDGAAARDDAARSDGMTSREMGASDLCVPPPLLDLGAGDEQDGGAAGERDGAAGASDLEGGCECNGSGAASAWWWLLMAVRRRRKALSSHAANPGGRRETTAALGRAGRVRVRRRWVRRWRWWGRRGRDRGWWTPAGRRADAGLRRGYAGRGRGAGRPRDRRSAARRGARCHQLRGGVRPLRGVRAARHLR